MSQRIHFTRYGLGRMQERGVTPAEVETTIARPEITHRQGPATLYMRGELTVVTLPAREGGVLVRNVLWRVSHRWTSEEMKRDRKR